MIIFVSKLHAFFCWIMAFLIISVSLTTWFPQACPWQTATYLLLHINKEKLLLNAAIQFLFLTENRMSTCTCSWYPSQVSSIYWNAIPFKSSESTILFRLFHWPKENIGKESTFLIQTHAFPSKAKSWNLSCDQ